MNSKSSAVSILLSTRNRASQLKRLLLSVQDQLIGGLACELIIVNNGSQDETESILEQSWDGFALRTIYEPLPGKSRSLNRALKVATGDLWVFTDDDVTASPRWLWNLYRAFSANQSAAVFCGPVIPVFPSNTPGWMRDHPFADAMFARFDPKLPEGPLPEGLLPFGPNFAVRSSAMSGMKFRLDLGPSADGPHFGDDTDFVQKFRDRGAEFIYVPDATVHHHIDSSRIEMGALMERSFLFGRATVARHGAPRYVHLRQEYLGATTNNDRVHLIERGGLINYYLGQLAELDLYGCSSFNSAIMGALDHLGFRSHLGLLSDSARHVYAAHFRDHAAVVQ